MKWHKIAFIALLLIAFTFTNVNAAIIKGNIFEWDTLKELNNVIIEINTTPLQRIVSINGSYEFNVPDGNYLITASYLENGKLIYFTKENIEVKGLGTYNLDLIMMPSLEDISEIIELNTTDKILSLDKTVEESLQGKSFDENLMFIILVLVFIVIASMMLFLFKKKARKIEEKAEKETKEIEENKEKEKIREQKESETKEKILEQKKEYEKEKRIPKLDSFALQAMQLLKRYGNRMTQKELVEKMNLSEAKVSLIVAELENEGLIKKIKKGRGNIIVLLEK